ncbi:MAG: class I SAM-dependent methyltransferase [Candidatus Bathyarchaeia archaeon]|jgi:cyclopropane fatty-acyl-phospholipid synthase-like methyltransferase
MANTIDWMQIRQELLKETRRTEIHQTSFWDKRACNMNQDMPQWAELTKKQLRKLPLTKNLTILDVGAGTGRITLPMAKRAKHVTALEPSKNMLAILKENAQKQLLENITYVNKSLEDFDLSSRYDLVVASFSLVMSNMKSALQKMDALAEEAVYLYMPASTWMTKDMQRALGISPSHWSDFIVIYNILYEAGIFANVDMYDYTFKRGYADLEEATADFLQTFRLSPDKKNQLKEYLNVNLVKKQGKLWSIQKRKAATIWWTKTK